MSYKGFEDLEVWRRSKDVCVKVFLALKFCRDFGLKDQMQRSAISIPSNISEGFERRSKKEFMQFLGYAKGSAGELKTQILIAGESKSIDQEEANKLYKEVKEISSMLQGLINHLSENPTK